MKNWLITFSFVLICFFSLFIAAIVNISGNTFKHFPNPNLELPAVANEKEGLFLERKKGLGIQLKKANDVSVEILCDDGATFVWPRQKSEFSEYLEEKAHQLETLSVLAMTVPEWIGTVQIFADKNIHFHLLNQILAPVSAAGFDEFDVALSVGSPKL